jgi:hypothetical protein
MFSLSIDVFPSPWSPHLFSHQASFLDSYLDFSLPPIPFTQPQGALPLLKALQWLPRALGQKSRLLPVAHKALPGLISFIYSSNIYQTPTVCQALSHLMVIWHTLLAQQACLQVLVRAVPSAPC